MRHFYLRSVVNWLFVHFCVFKHDLHHLAVLPLSQGCVPGVNKPSFLTPTPLHGDVHHAAVGEAHEITLRAQISDSRSEKCFVFLTQN